jgi:hypothetical protein
MIHVARNVSSEYAYFAPNRSANSTATASPTSFVDEVPPISPVRIPFSMLFLTAVSTAIASSSSQREYFSIMLTESNMATGLTMPLPEISGAEPKGN